MTATLPESVDLLLQRMVQFDTVNSAVSGKPCAEAALTQYLEERARQCFFQTRRLPVEGQGDNLLILHQVHRDKPWLLLDSHLDTVGVEGMTIAPFGGEIRDGRLLGRGACDTKGTGAAMFWALRQYADKPPQPNNVALLYSVSEEIGMWGMQSFCRNDLPNVGFTPRAAIVGEPTTLRPVTAHNGVLRWTITTRGVAAHSAAPQLGRSAISMMINVLHAFESRYIANLNQTHPLTGKAVCSVNMIEGGSQINIIPETCRAEVDRRTLPDEDPDAVLAAVEAILDELRRCDPGLCVQQHVDVSRPGLDPATNAALLPVVQAALSALDLPTDALGAPFCTHAGELSRAGVPAIVLGPGSPWPAHTKDEYVDLSQIRRGVELYAALMRAELP